MGSQIYGEVFSPCFMTEEEFEKGYQQSIFYVEKDYMQEYRNHIVAMSHIANIAKVYILKNWEKVTDWTNLNVIVKHGPTGELTEYYNYIPSVKTPNSKRKRSEIIDRVFEEIEELDKDKHNPIRIIDKVVLDPTDGDFSLTINGKEHWWIQNEAVIIIADYIEQQLKLKEDENSKSSTK